MISKSMIRRFLGLPVAEKPAKTAKPMPRSALKASSPALSHIGNVSDVYSRAYAGRDNSVGQKAGKAGVRLLHEQVLTNGRLAPGQLSSLVFAHVAYPAGTPGSVVNRPLPVGVRGTQMSSAAGCVDKNGILHVFAWVALKPPVSNKAKVRFADA